MFRDTGAAYGDRVRRWTHPERAQASIELVVLLPALLVLTVAAWQAAMAGWALVSAQSAAGAAARAALAGSPPWPAALAALPAGMRAGAVVERHGDRVTVRVRVPAVLPGFAADVTASAAGGRQ